MAYCMILDTETTSLDKPFCYDIGYTIFDMDTMMLVKDMHYVVEQGYIMRNMYRDIKQYNITDAYAYNSDFDDKVITFNCDWFKCNNPLENVAIHDIWGYASEFITNNAAYTAFCEQHERFTDTGNYKGSAEVVYQYLTNNPDFVEEHMGLYDSQIETYILAACIELGAQWASDYKVKKVLPRVTEKPFTVKVNGKVIYEGKYVKKYARNDTYNFTTK